MSDKEAGWYYIGDGTLRYRDDYGWTDFYKDSDYPRAKNWPPPKPKTLIQQFREDEARRTAIAPPRRVLSLWARGHHYSGRHRSIR